MTYLKTFAVAILLLSMKLVVAQNVLIDKQGVAHFYSEAPLEDIEATNEKAVGAIDLDKGTVAVTMLSMKIIWSQKSIQKLLSKERLQISHHMISPNLEQSQPKPMENSKFME